MHNLLDLQNILATFWDLWSPQIANFRNLINVRVFTTEQTYQPYKKYWHRVILTIFFYTNHVIPYGILYISFRITSILKYCVHLCTKSYKSVLFLENGTWLREVNIIGLMISLNCNFKEEQMCSILTKGSTCRNIPKPWKQAVKYNIPVFISIGQNYFTALYVSKYCFASFYIFFSKT